jgi:hypothetical protein
MPCYYKLLQAIYSIFLVICITFTTSYSQGVTITGGVNLVVNGSAHIVINDGGFNNGGVFSAGTGTVSFTGTASSSVTAIGGSSAISFYNIGFIKSSGSARLLQSISVSNNVGMQLGNLDLSGFDLNLGSTGNIVGESSSSYITGTAGGNVVRTIILNAPNAVNPGNTGIEITSSANLGPTIITRGHAQQTTSSGYSIYRYYDIVPANNTNLNANVRFSYTDAELAGINESELKLWSLSPNGNWNLLGADNQDVNANYVDKSSINSFSRLTLASTVSNPLPVTFVLFNGQVAGNSAALQWHTGTEINSRHFEVERSFDGRNFLSVATVNGSGNVTGSVYQHFDNTVFASRTMAYYRIKEVSKEGRYTYSKAILLATGSVANRLIGAYPNPVSGPLHLRFTTDGREKFITLLVFNQSGQIVASKLYNVQPGLNDITYEMSGLTQGSYIMRFAGLDIGPVYVIKK